MPRRSWTLMVSGTLLFLLVTVAYFFTVPYVALSPGDPTDTLGSANGKTLITVNGHPTYPAAGHLYMTTVLVPDAGVKMDLFEAVRDWLDPNVAVVPRSEIYPKGESQQEIQQQAAEDMKSSQESATT